MPQKSENRRAATQRFSRMNSNLGERMFELNILILNEKFNSAMIQVADESPLRALYFRWQELKDEFWALPPCCDEKAEDAVYNEILRLEQQAADFKPQTMEDLIFKIIFADDNGDMDVNIHQSALVTQAYEMAGIKPRIRKGA